MATRAADGGRLRARTAIVLAALSGTAFFLAVGTTQLTAAAIFDRPFEPSDTPPAPEVSAEEARRNRTEEGTAILQRDIFDSRLGPLEWDAPVIKYLPWFQMSDPYVTRELTVRDLLVHRSGLGLGAGDLLWWPPSTYDRKEIARRLRHIPFATSFRSTSMPSGRRRSTVKLRLFR